MSDDTRANTYVLLTQEEVNALPNGTRIMVTWDGGNGPHEYVYEDGVAYAENRRVGFLDFVGKERFHQRVWRISNDD